MKDQNLRKAFSNPPKHFYNMVDNTLNNLTKQKGDIKMKKLTFKKSLVFAAMTILALSTTAFALGKATSIIGSSGTVDYKTFPTVEKVQKDTGISPQLVANFNNGFTFRQGNVSDNKALDENRNVVDKYKSVHLDYEKGMANVIVTMQDSKISYENSNNVNKTSYNGVELQYTSHISKSVPDDYIMTEQDIRDSESGKCTFNTGGNIVTEQLVQGVNWQKDNVRYAVIEMGESLTEQDLIAMAQQIINAK